jgi:hypothetical protein
VKKAIILVCTAAIALAGAQLIGSYTVTVTETVSGNKHNEEVGITQGDDYKYMLHRAIGDTVTIEEGFRRDNFYFFREFRANGSLTVCRIVRENIFGLSLDPLGFLFSFTSGPENPLETNVKEIAGIYTARGGEGPDIEYESILNVSPALEGYLIEQDFDGDGNPEITGFGLAVEGVLAVAAEPVETSGNWILAGYEFEGDGSARGQWLTMVSKGEGGEIKEFTGWEDLEFIQGFGE